LNNRIATWPAVKAVRQAKLAEAVGACVLTQVEVNEVFRFMRDVRACHTSTVSTGTAIAHHRLHGIPKFLPTMQCHVGLYFLSNSFFMYAAMSFSMLYFSSAYNRTVELEWSNHQPDPSRPWKPATSNWPAVIGAAHTCVAQSTASACISSDISAFLMTAFRSVMVAIWSLQADLDLEVSGSKGNLGWSNVQTLPPCALMNLC
jgi:hypothetical protein